MFAWLTGGDNLVAREGAAGVAAAGYDGDNVTVVTSSIEGQRLRDEEVGDDVEVVEHPWHERGVEDAVADVATTPAAADVAWDGFERIDRSDVTQPLTDADVERYRELGRETAEAVEEVTRGVSAGRHRARTGRAVALPASAPRHRLARRPGRRRGTASSGTATSPRPTSRWGATPS